MSSNYRDIYPDEMAADDCIYCPEGHLRVERPCGEVWELEVEAAVPEEGGFAVRLAGIARRIE